MAGRLKKTGGVALDASPSQSALSSSRHGKMSPRTPAHLQGPAGGPLIPEMPGVPLTIEGIVAALKPQFESVENNVTQFEARLETKLSTIQESVAVHDVRIEKVENKVDHVSSEIASLKKRMDKLEMQSQNRVLTVSGFDPSVTDEQRQNVILEKLQKVCGSIEGYLAPSNSHTFMNPHAGKNSVRTRVVKFEFPNTKSRYIVSDAFKNVKDWSHAGQSLNLRFPRTAAVLHQNYVLRQAGIKLGKEYPAEKKENAIEEKWMQWPRIITMKGGEVFSQPKGSDGCFVGKCSHLNAVDPEGDSEMKK